jgi:sugar lactone lactonase YvrE
MTLHAEDLDFLGGDLVRPECLLATRAGKLYAADWRGGVTKIAPDGQQSLILASSGPEAGPVPIKPNGIAMEPDGSFLLANLGDAGGLWRLRRDGALTPVATEIDGQPIPPANFPLVDSSGRIWLTISTRRQPRALGYRPDIDDGYILRIDGRGIALAADGLGYTNEVQVHPSGDWLYVNETFGRRLSRFKLQADGRLTDRETVAEFGAGTYPDGLAFDAEGQIWITSIISNRVIRVDDRGNQELILEDVDKERLAEIEVAFLSGRLDRPHLDTAHGRVLHNISSLTFAGPDLKTAILGCLLGDRLALFPSPVAGHPPVHWTWEG